MSDATAASVLVGVCVYVQGHGSDVGHEWAQITMPDFREHHGDENKGGAAGAAGAAMPNIALPPAIKATIDMLKFEKSKIFDKIFDKTHASKGLGYLGHLDGFELEAKATTAMSRRTRGGTPALFEALAGPAGNYGAADGGKPNLKPPLLVNGFNIPRSNLMVHVRRMRLAYLGQDKAARIDKRLDSRADRSTHAVPIADMGKFQEVLIRRAAQGASPLRDPHLDSEEVHRRNRTQFGNPFRKGERGLNLGLASDEIEGEAEAASGGNSASNSLPRAQVRGQDRRRRRPASSGACCVLPCFSWPRLTLCLYIGRGECVWVACVRVSLRVLKRPLDCFPCPSSLPGRYCRA